MTAILVHALLGASLLLAVPVVVADVAPNDGSMPTCDDFDSCPEGWSLVASPSLVLCDQTCKWETCCSSDVASEVIQETEETERRLSGNATTTTHMATTTTVYQPPATNATNATTTLTTTATATATGTSTITSTASTTTTYQAEATTTTLPVAADGTEVVLVTGTLTVEVTGDVQAFIANPEVKASFLESIATQAVVPQAWVDVVLSASRRLSEGTARLRRLAVVQVAYTITIPHAAAQTGQSTPITAAAVKAAIESATATTFTDAVVAKLAAKGVTGFVVAVTAVGAVDAALADVTTTTTATTTVPGTEDDDSFALTKVAFTPAHALALLAAVASVVSL